MNPGGITLLVNWDSYDVTNPEIGEVRQVTEIHDHPDYDWRTLENDVSLLYISEPSTYRPVEIDDGTYSQVGQMGPVLGWGRTNNGSPTNWPDQPHMVDVPIWTNFRCNEPSSYPGQVTDDMVCAGETGKCSCNGDSGGPLVTEVGGGLYYITGVVSWGATTCGAANRPGVYARVSVFKDWIDGFITESNSSHYAK
jgi:secreted trypsin-like serine protease